MSDGKIEKVIVRGSGGSSLVLAIAGGLIGYITTQTLMGTCIGALIGLLLVPGIVLSVILFGIVLFLLALMAVAGLYGAVFLTEALRGRNRPRRR